MCQCYLVSGVEKQHTISDDTDSLDRGDDDLEVQNALPTEEECDLKVKI